MFSFLSCNWVFSFDWVCAVEKNGWADDDMLNGAVGGVSVCS